jgi:hypothetical protein
MPIKPINAPIAAEVRQDNESEAALIQAAKQAITTCNWKVGEAASNWTAKWAKGRTDADFGAAVDLTGDQVGQRRRVWERWGEKLIPYRNLSWSHFAVSVAWEDADTYLEWAYANQATVSEMKAYRHARTANEFLPPAGERGGDPFVEAGPNDDPFEWIDPDGNIYEQERAAAATTEAAEEFLDGMEAEVEEEEASRPPRNGREAPAEVDPKEVFQTTKAKAVKTLEAGMRAVDDVHRLRTIPQHDKLIKGLEKMLQTVKEVS